MMYPVAVDGQMPFVDRKSYRDQQIKKVIQKHRAKRQRECLEESRDTNNSLHTPIYRVSHHPRLSPDECDNKQDANLLNKRNILHAIKKWFSTGSKSRKTEPNLIRTSSTYQPRYSRNRPLSSPVNIIQSRKTSLNSNSPPGVSPKRQRRRTVSNIGSIMETIEEIPENLTLEDESDSDDSLGSTGSLTSCKSMASNNSSMVLLLTEVKGHASYTNKSTSTNNHCSNLNTVQPTNLLPCTA